MSGHHALVLAVGDSDESAGENVKSQGIGHLEEFQDRGSSTVVGAVRGHQHLNWPYMDIPRNEG